MMSLYNDINNLLKNANLDFNDIQWMGTEDGSVVISSVNSIRRILDALPRDSHIQNGIVITGTVWWIQFKEGEPVLMQKPKKKRRTIQMDINKLLDVNTIVKYQFHSISDLLKEADSVAARASRNKV